LLRSRHAHTHHALDDAIEQAEIFANIFEWTSSRIEQLQATLSEAEKRSAGKACVYATGSFGRGEANPHSDLDLFIVGKADGQGKRVLKRLDEICIKADLIEATRELKIPEFSGDGRYLEHYTVQELTRTLGTPDDDSINTFTARLLLLLESCPLLERAVYDEISEVIVAYWRDYEDHKNEFMPAFLANDILRLWRTYSFVKFRRDWLMTRF
jgi:predicted nucleotidyltransferase